ncbi:Cd2+/Zn2+-exporting ATPase [Gillisia mitskevichiae]|uniref:P-type Zn(2+) transporter n=1 Tax=Gillisia mitskevichiae TaxID=270921 RepID=A0A495PZ74_9FLAO|nr:heavy metal translocating P-type ATPase [Gillisia mitskevichiae]RKS55510.1 Cd2+/Zn2+-exporting ATPase [Gillisia mitskevichiae]
MSNEKIVLEEANQDCCGSCAPTTEKSKFKLYFPALFSFIMLSIGLIIDNFLETSFFNGWFRIGWYFLAYLPVGYPVLMMGVKNILKGSFFTEFFLMSIAAIGAFAIGEYPEGVAVMLFYAVGELFQESAVKSAKSNIKALLDVRPNIASVWRENHYIQVHPENVKIGEKIQVKSGERIPLDAKLISEKAELNTSALTGESKPISVKKGDLVLSGSINLNAVIEVETTKLFNESAVARIIELVQNASSRKAKTELFIRKFAKVYTPFVVISATLLTFVPYLIVENYIFSDWLYRALIFLVVSCPCALVISVPLGYFGGLGAASKNGILFKGASYLDEITKINTLVMDKTGTLTKGVFKVQEIETKEIEKEEFLNYLIALEKKSTHPIARAIVEGTTSSQNFSVEEVKEISGKGLEGKVNNKKVLVGNAGLLEQYKVKFPAVINSIVDTTVLVAIDGIYAGYVTVADELKEDAKKSILELKNFGINKILMLSGDKDSITQKVAVDLGIAEAKGDLLPEDKLNEVEELKNQLGRKVAFIGDGINDAPVLAVSDVGIAMGGLGSDVAIETADVVIQTDQLSKILMGIKIGKSTRNVVWQNIGLAFAVKAVVLILGTVGLATMWGAVFADVGVALLAILNAVRLQKMKWD